MKYFIDTNVFIDVLNKKDEAIALLTKIVSEDDNILYINKLVNLESLRTIPIKNTKIFNNAKDTLESFEKVDISAEIYNKTIDFSRFFKTVKHENLKGKCETIDLLHFMTAKYYDLELISYDKDFDKLERIYQKFLQSSDAQ
jgi:predicted nucleic acid-binding protein